MARRTPASPTRIEVVTLPADELARLIENAAAQGYTRAAEERERAMAALADRLEAATTAVGLKAWLTVREAALYAGRTEDTVRRWIKSGLVAQSGTRGYVIRRDDLDAWRAGLPADGGAGDSSPTGKP